MILVGLIFGLTMFVSNVQGILEIVMVYLLLFWETQVLRTLLRKNLSSHKHRNFLTSIIYSLTLGCIIFLLVTANLQVQSVTGMHNIESADIVLDQYMGVDPKLTDPILEKYADEIEDFGYMSSILNYYQNDQAEFQFADRANLVTKGQYIYAVQPSQLFDDSFISYSFKERRSALSATE